MSKNKVIQNEIVEDEFDFSGFMEPDYDDEVMAGMMGNMMDDSHYQMKAAIDLTKIAVEKQSTKEMDVETVFSIYKRALEVVVESSPLKSVLEKCSGEH